jgi:hypothetical protein
MSKDSDTGIDIILIEIIDNLDNILYIRVG